MSLLILKQAARRLDEIYQYTREQWGEAQADRYLTGMFAAMDGIESHRTLSRPIPATLGVSGYCLRYEQHIVYWQHLTNGDIGIVTILHRRMHQIDRLRQDFGL